MTQINWQYQVNNRAGGYIVKAADWNDFAGNFRAFIDQTTGSGTTDNAALPIGVDLVNHKVFISDPTSTTACPPEAANNTATAQLQVSSNAENATIAITAAHDTEATSAVLLMRKADGTQASPALVDDDAVLGTIQFQGYDGNSWANGAKIIAMTNGTPADGDMPTEMLFQVTPDGGSETPATAFKISPSKDITISDGNLTIYDASSSANIWLAGAASGYTQSAIMLQAGQNGDAGTDRGTGAYGFNQATDTTWYWGNPYAYTDSWRICRKSSTTSLATDAAHGGTYKLFTVQSNGDCIVGGALSKGSGSFDIPHPVKGGDWRLRHSFIEGPQADNIYRGTATIDGSSATVDLDAVSNMTAGTWEALNTNGWAMVSSSGNAVEWSLSGKTLTITGPDKAVCSWLVIGERHDDHMKSQSSIADSNGKLITEYEGEDEKADMAP
jgi:hypothetical protein